MIDRDLITVLYRLIASKTTNITAKYLAVQNGGYEWHLASHTILPPLSIKTSTPSLPVSSMTLLCNDVIADLLSISIMCSATIITTSTMMASSSKYWMLPITLSATADSAISCTTSCTGWTFLRGCSTSCVQQSIDVCSTKHHSTWRTAASTPQTLLVASICWVAGNTLPQYTTHGCIHISDMYGHRTFSVAGPAAWNSLPDYLRDPSHSFDGFRRDLKTFLFSFYQCTQCIRGFVIMHYVNLLLTLTLTLTMAELVATIHQCSLIKRYA